MKYLEAHWEQLECLFKNFPYSRLQEAWMNQFVRTYHGSSGKSSIAHNEWLELTNKDFAGMPTVRTLEGMMRQGAYIGMIQQCKRAVEVIYSAGAMNKRVVHRSGTGAKGNGGQEKSLIMEVFDLFLGDINNSIDVNLKLKSGSMIKLQSWLTTKLEQSKLDREMGNTPDGDSMLD
jgi:hypothetical protein